MASTITGNVGGSGFSGAQVQAENVRTKAVSFTVADGSGNYSVGSLAAGEYRVSASFSGYVYYKSHQVVVDGSSTYAAVNLSPTLLTASNNPPASDF
jgi:hypothetical protein